MKPSAGWLKGLSLFAYLIPACAPESSDPGPHADFVSAQAEPGDAASASPTIRLRTEGKRQWFEVTGLHEADIVAIRQANLDTPRWQGFFSVSVVAKQADAPPMLGAYRIEADSVQFLPRFPLVPGLEYRARLDVAQLPGQTGRRLRAPVEARFTLPRKPATPTTEVTHVYPSASVLPENLLKFYLHFSAPMTRGEAYDHVRLLDERGKAMDLPFLDLGEELWDPSGTRLTLLLDPGRIKRGLRPREEAGPILVAGKSYTLVIDRNWPDAEGNPLRSETRKPFQAGREDDVPVDPAKWIVSAPRAGTSDPLVITFPEPLDHALLQHTIKVISPDGSQRAGRVEVDRGETRWQFTPQERWASVAYQLRVNTILEDLAGNSVGRPFEVDAFKPIQQRVETESVTLPLEIR